MTFSQIQDALKPLWKYAGAQIAGRWNRQCYEEEPGIKFPMPPAPAADVLDGAGDEDFRQSLDEMCMSLNELAQDAIEVTFYDTGVRRGREPRRRIARRFRDALRRADPAAIM